MHRAPDRQWPRKLALLSGLYVVVMGLFMALVGWSLNKSWVDLLGSFWIPLLGTGVVTVAVGMREMGQDD